MSVLQTVGAGSETASASARVASRVRSLQCEAVNGAAPSAAANLPAILVFAFIIRHDVSPIALAIWIGAAALILTALVAFANNLPSSLGNIGASNRLAIHSVFAVLIGGLWGSAALYFGPSLSEAQMMVFGLIVLVCNAACISGIGPHLPAFFGYCLGSTVPLTIALYRRGEPETHDLAFLIPLYIAVVGFNARDYNRQVLSAFRLRAENEELAENLARANVATAEAKRSKWNTLAHLSHELRTPMNAIMGFSQMMRDEIFGQLTDRYRDYSGHIHDSGRHMLELVDTILDVSRAETGNLIIEDGEFVPADLIEECLQKVGYAAAAKRLALERDFTPAPHLIADRTKLRQALLHLLNNAVAYTRDGGRVAVMLTSDTHGLEIAVTDTGVGIAPEDLERCQEPFVRVGNPLIAGAEGAGLGLPLARRVVEAHGGTLGLESEPGRGTTATIRFPAARCVWRGEERKRA